MHEFYVQDSIKELYLTLAEKKEEEITIELIDQGYEETKTSLNGSDGVIIYITVAEVTNPIFWRKLRADRRRIKYL